MNKKDENYLRGVRLKEALRQNNVTKKILEPTGLSKKRISDLICCNFKSVNDYTVVLVCKQIGIDPYDIVFGGDHFNPYNILKALEDKGFTPKALWGESDIKESIIKELLQGKFPRDKDTEKMIKEIESYRKELSKLLDISQDIVFPTSDKFIFAALRRESSFKENQAIVQLLEICKSLNSDEKLKLLIRYAEDLQSKDKEQYNNLRDKFQFEDLYEPYEP